MSAPPHGPVVARLAFDLEVQELAVTMSDGTELRAPMTMPHPWQDLSYAEADLATRELTMRLRGGKTLVVELGGDGADEGRLRGPGRQVVSLDQRHWITLSSSAYTTRRGSPETTGSQPST